MNPNAIASNRHTRAACPKLNRWLNHVLPDPRNQQMCLDNAAHLWGQVIGTFLSRKGSRNGFDQQRQSGQAAWNMGQLCDQSPEDPRFEGEPTITCSDNATPRESRSSAGTQSHRGLTRP
jgi:hypothetical protein